MSKEKVIELFKSLSPEEKIEVVKAIMPEFCQNMMKDPRQMQEIMKVMMAFMGGDMATWMGMMKG